MRFREHRKLLSGRMSGRNRAEQLDGGDDTDESSSLAAYSASAGGEGATAATAAAAEAEVEAARKKAKDALPPLREDIGGGEGEGGGEGGVEIEWWDDAFLTKEMRDDKVCMCSYLRKGIHLQGYVLYTGTLRIFVGVSNLRKCRVLRY